MLKDSQQLPFKFHASINKQQFSGCNQNQKLESNEFWKEKDFWSPWCKTKHKLHQFKEGFICIRPMPGFHHTPKYGYRKRFLTILWGENVLACSKVWHFLCLLASGIWCAIYSKNIISIFGTQLYSTLPKAIFLHSYARPKKAFVGCWLTVECWKSFRFLPKQLIFKLTV